MNKNLLIVLGGGFLVAILVAFIVSATLSGGEETVVQTAAEEPRVEIAVADRNIEIGQELTDKNMRWQEWPENATFPGAIVRADNQPVAEAVSGKVKRSIKEGEPIFESALVTNKAGNFVAATLEEGMRAVAIAVDATKMAGGFIGPGDYVDIILTYRQSVDYEGMDSPQIENFIDMNIDQYATETILQNVKVLAVDQAATRDEEGEAVRVGRTVTLQVDLQGAEVLALSQEMGELSLALRQLGDKNQYKRHYKVVTDKRITSVTDELFRDVAEYQKTSGQNADIVRIYNGFTLEETSVSQ